MIEKRKTGSLRLNSQRKNGYTNTDLVMKAIPQAMADCMAPTK
ncbi:MAG: hypothetical protein ABSA71_12840 [Desulfomonilia bacterium]